MNINLRQVRSFVAVAQLKSFTRAATLLHLSQPALTVQIRRLEDALGVRLLDRNTRAVDLTRVGRDLMPVFQRLLRELDAVILDTRDLAAKRRGIVRIPSLPSFAAGVLPEVIARFRKQHPRVSFQIRDAIANRVLAYVRDEDVDIGVIGGEVPDAEIEVVYSMQDRMHVVFPAGHPLQRVRTVTFEAVADYPLVLMDPDTSVRQLVDAACMDIKRMTIPACEATYMMTAVGMVRAGLGIAILPASAPEIRTEPGLRSRPIDGPRFARTIAIIKKSGRTLPPATASSLEQLVSAMTQAGFFSKAARG
jgi:DNA-binding transcriptional LysR family regulator